MPDLIFLAPKISNALSISRDLGIYSHLISRPQLSTVQIETPSQLKMKHSLTILLIGILCSSAAGAPEQKPLVQATYPGQTRYICDECVPRELILAPGIGFDLTSSYG
jgi:hypothetical protein